MSAQVLFPSEQTNYRRKVILTICLILSVLGSLGAVYWRWTNGVDTQNHAVRVMFSVVTDYVSLNDGAWPDSWQAIRKMPSAGNWYDPVDYDLMEREVRIDFAADPAELAKLTPATFQAVGPVNPVFDFAKDPRLVLLIEKLKQFHPPTN